MAGGGSAPRGEPWLAPTQAAPCPLGPHAALLCRLLRSGGSGGSRAPQSTDTLGKQMIPPGTCPPCTMVMWAWSATPRHCARLCSGSPHSSKPKGGRGGRQADKAGGTAAPCGVPVWWQGHLGSVGPLTESASGHLGGSALTSHTWWVNFSEKPLLSASLNTKAPFYVMMRAPTLSEDTLILNM